MKQMRTATMENEQNAETEDFSSPDVESADLSTRILIVDDRQENLDVMREVLSDANYLVLTARSGMAALRLMLQHEFALVILDVRMPTMDGFETARFIRSREKTKRIPIIFLTAFNYDEAEIRRGYALGAVDFIVKPIDPHILESKVSVFAELHHKNSLLRRQEELLRRNRDELDLRVRERTAELARVNEHLRDSLNEKVLLLKEIHHRVKNNLQVISSILSLQSNYVSEPRLAEIFQEFQGRINSIALVHELLYQTEHLARIDFGEYLRDLVDNLSRFYLQNLAQVHIDVKTAPRWMSLDSAMHCGLVATELLTNAMKYAFPENGEGRIDVILGGSGSNYVLEVSDNGIGLPDGFDIHATESLGLKLVDILAQQLNGELTVLSENGTTVRLRFHDELHDGGESK